ncbi:MAG: HEAT repeat domain-containing protein [bacterium]
MARISLKERIANLEKLVQEPCTDNVIPMLRKTLCSAESILVAKAAKIAAKRELTELIPDLVEAFNYFIAKPAKADPGCLAKMSVVKALDTLYYNDLDDVFLRGVHYVQMEPVYGGHVDTAAELRGKAAFALARINHPEILFILTALLMDPELQARSDAVVALTYLARPESELLLRMKVMAGDPEQDIIRDCFSGLMNINPEHSMHFVAQFLSSKEPMMIEDAALALGESKELEALKILCEKRDHTVTAKIKNLFIVPIALTKSDAAFDYLVDIISNEQCQSAVLALKALEIFAHSPEQCRRIKQAVESRDDATVSEAYHETFDQ